MVQFSVTNIAKVLKGEFRPSIQVEDCFISSLSIDSRTVFDPESSLFFALKSERNNGHRYIADLVHLGVRAFVVSDYSEELRIFENCFFIVVPDTLAALQQLAAWHRSQFLIPVLGITGSNGKTIVKEWLFDLLKNRSVIRSPKSYNSQIGVPLSVWNLNTDHELAIFEAGISRVGEMQKLQQIIRPSIGILTNIGEAHQENFTSRQQKLEEKLKLFQSCDTLIYCSDHKFEDELIRKGGINPKVKLLTWSFTDETAEFYFHKKDVNGNVEISATYEGKDFHINLPFQDAANLENAGHCLAFILSQHYADPSVLELFRYLQPVAMRLAMKERVNNCLLINDYYNSDINSLQIALGFLKNHARHPYIRKVVILSDIQQAGIPDIQLYQEVARLLQLNKTSYLIGIGPVIRKHAGLFSLPSEFYESTDLFLESVRISDFDRDCVLLKGARDFHFERISSVLQKKYHQTVLEIDLNVMISNLNVFRSLIRPETRVMVMVKAFSYGSGMAEIARILQFHKVDYLAFSWAHRGI